ncbi:uncharacterized protein LOC121881105 [Thunnus maccoyii]|uniref:uncharacterized protein LOC121881105 n=1 Tax=Thunnus maccoyii TaxID=8240 RepID=UPI001C4A9069|nr:uncharacterized protein LOC121881105 [Thunnus maccoyii]
MSVKEAQTGSSVKKVLRRKLTVPSHLLPGKAKIKTGRHRDINYSCNKTDISVQSCEEKISEEVKTGRQRKSPQADQLDQNRFAQKLTALKQIFSTSVDCFTCTFKSDHNEGEYRAVTIFNTHTRDSVDLKTQPAVDGFSATEIQQCTTAEYKSSVEEREAIHLNPLITVTKLKSKAKSSRPENSSQLKTCWRKRPKKASPFFQECIGESKEYIPLEMIVLANKHTDESRTPSTYPNEIKCPDVLTVSVDVTDITSEMSNEDREAFETSHASDDMNVMAGPRGNGGGIVIGSEEYQISPHSSEKSRFARNSTLSQDFGHHLTNLDNLPQRESINTPNVNTKRTAPEHPTFSDEIRLHAAFNSDSYSIHHNAVAENAMGPMGNTMPAGTVTENVAVMENLDIDTSDSSFYARMVHSEQNAEQQCEERELFLLQTARFVVQVAIKTALKLFEEEQLDTAAHLDC